MRELVASSVGSAIRLRFAVDPDCAAVLADGNQMEMALLNLAINARDAMPAGGELVFAAAMSPPPAGLLADGDYVRITVTDSGEGMAPELVAKVFEPFFTTKGVKGTGLGLSQVYGMAQQSGGAARIVSEQGVGTTVEIWLRAATNLDEAEPAPVAQMPVREPAGAHPDRGRRRLRARLDGVVARSARPQGDAGGRRRSGPARRCNGRARSS